MKRFLPLCLVMLALGVLTALAASDPAHGFVLPALGLVATAGLSPKEMLEKRGDLLAGARTLLDTAKAEKRDLSPEEDEQWSEMITDADAYKTAVDQEAAKRKAILDRENRLKEAEEESKKLGNLGDLKLPPGSAAPPEAKGGAPTIEDRALAIQGWFLNQCSRSDAVLSDQHREAAKRVGLRLDARDLILNFNPDFRNRRAQILNALQTKSGPAGGYLRPESFADALETAMLWYGGILQVADVIRTTTGEPIHWPTANDTTNTGRQIGEGKPVADVDPSFGKKMLYAYPFTSDSVLVTYQLLRDNPFNLASLLGDMLGERLGRVINTKCTVGSGAATPEGIVNAAVEGKETASATAITADELLDLQYSVDKAYRDAPGAGWMMHDQTAKVLRKLTANERFHWVDGMNSGEPSMLFGKPVTINNDMADTLEAGAKSILFGQLTKYKVRLVGQVRIHRLTERYRAESDSDAFLAFTEADGKLVDAGVDPIKYMLQLAS